MLAHAIATLPILLLSIGRDANYPCVFELYCQFPSFIRSFAVNNARVVQPILPATD